MPQFHQENRSCKISITELQWVCQEGVQCMAHSLKHLGQLQRGAQEIEAVIIINPLSLPISQGLSTISFKNRAEEKIGLLGHFQL